MIYGGPEVDRSISRSLCPHIVLWEANDLLNRVQAKNLWKKIWSSFSDRNKLEFNDADLDLQIGWVQTFFLWKYLILSNFFNLKTPTKDSILWHKRDFIHHFFTKGTFACLVLLLMVTNAFSRFLCLRQAIRHYVT